jgi:hypothetical protein
MHGCLKAVPITREALHGTNARAFILRHLPILGSFSLWVYYTMGVESAVPGFTVTQTTHDHSL